MAGSRKKPDFFCAIVKNFHSFFNMLAHILVYWGWLLAIRSFALLWRLGRECPIAQEYG